MNKLEIATNRFKNNCNCAQSSLVALASDQFEEKTLQLIASSFGGGISQQGNTCGAVIGSLMALGLKRGYTDVNNNADAKINHYKLANKFITSFKEKFGSDQCKELIQYDISNPEEKLQAKEKGVFDQICPRYVMGAVEIMNNILKE